MSAISFHWNEEGRTHEAELCEDKAGVQELKSFA